MRLSVITLLTTLLLVIVSGCGGEEYSEKPLTNHQLRHGIGPVDTVQLAPLNQRLARNGKQIFRDKCMKCHLMDKPNLGPPLGDVLRNRTPEFVMNMILNPQENVMRHPVLQKYRQQYNQMMTSQGLDSTAARAILEYFRSVTPSD